MVTVVDIREPMSPAIVGSVATLDHETALEVYGDKLYVTDASDGLTVVDISDPDAPVVESLIPCAYGSLSDLDISNGCAVVTDSVAGVHIVDLMEVARAPTIWTYVTGSDGISIDVQGGIAAVAQSSPYRVVFYDVSDPASVRELSSVPAPVVPPPPDGWDHAFKGVVLSGSHAYLRYGYSLYFSAVQVIDLADPEMPEVRGSVEYPGSLSYEIAAWGPYLYLSNYTSGVRVTDVPDASNPSPAPSFLTPGAYDVCPSDSLILVATVDTGLQIFDNTNKSAPVLLGTRPTSNTAYKVAADFDSGVAYVVAGTRVDTQVVNRTAIVTVDISNPSSPSEMGSFPYPDLDNPTLSGHLLFAHNKSGEIIVFDASDPENLPEIARYSCPGVID